MAGHPDPEAVSRALWVVTRSTQDANHAFARGCARAQRRRRARGAHERGPARPGRARAPARHAVGVGHRARRPARGGRPRRAGARPGDRRRITVVPTPHAHEEAGAAVGPLLAGLEAAAAALKPEERTVVVRYLEDVAAALKAYAAEG
jgi:hypothetical protein